MLSCEPALVTAADPGTLVLRLLANRSTSEINQRDGEVESTRFPRTFLIDDCHHSFGTSERQPLIALLNCGSDVSSRYSHGKAEYVVACPKAFAGNTPLPASLASRCIPVVRHCRKFSDQIQRFFADDLLTPGNALKQWLKDWIDEIAPRLKETRSKPIQFPPALTPRQQQCAEPLLRIANMIGGSWPARARASLMAAFGIAQNQVQVLWDIRDLFLLHNQPERLPSQDVTSYLRSLEDRPWNRWGSNHLSILLRPFGIFSRDQ